MTDARKPAKRTTTATTTKTTTTGTTGAAFDGFTDEERAAMKTTPRS